MGSARLFLTRRRGIYLVICMLLTISLCFGCEPSLNGIDEARPEKENKTDTGSEATTETSLDAGHFAGHPYPIFFEDPSIDYLGIAKHEILTRYGDPEETGYYGGGYYLSYGEKAGLLFFFPSEDDENNFTSSVWITRGDIMGVCIGDTFSEIISAWGEPVGIEYDDLENQGWGLSYSFENREKGVSNSPIWVVFFAESREGPTGYALIKREQCDL